MAGTGHASAELVVIANPASGLTSLSRDEVVNLFLGRFRQFPAGIAAEPLDLPAEMPERAAFYRLLVHKEPAEINSYWARLVFSGRTSRPRQANGVDDLLNSVARRPGAIGYLDRSRVDARVKVVFELTP